MTTELAKTLSDPIQEFLESPKEDYYVAPEIKQQLLHAKKQVTKGNQELESLQLIKLHGPRGIEVIKK